MQIFDAHFHIIDGRFPLIPNQGYLLPFFTSNEYLQRTQNYNLIGGVIVLLELGCVLLSLRFKTM